MRVDHGLAAREALVSGRGIAPAHRWLVGDLLESGRIEVVLPDYSLPSVPLNVLVVPERAGISRVRLLIDFLANEIGKLPGMDRSRTGNVSRPLFCGAACLIRKLAVHLNDACPFNRARGSALIGRS